MSDEPSNDTLLLEYEEAARRHGEAAAAFDSDSANQAHDVVAAVYRELRRRGRSAQLGLLPLLASQSLDVRLWAASHALEFEPHAAEPVLTALELAGGLVGFNAKMTLEQWRRGKLRFD